jgi:hypothetical protein
VGDLACVGGRVEPGVNAFLQVPQERTDRGEGRVGGGLVQAHTAGQPSSMRRYVDADQDECDRHAHEGPDEIESVLIVDPVHAQPGDVMDDQRLGAVIVRAVPSGIPGSGA